MKQAEEIGMVVLSTNDYTLVEYSDDKRGAYRYEVVNKRDDKSTNYDSLSEAVRYIYEIDLK